MVCCYCKKEIDQGREQHIATCPEHGMEYVCTACDDKQFVRNFRVHIDAYKHCFPGYSDHMIAMYSVYDD
jgi:hypothetical protein